MKTSSNNQEKQEKAIFYEVDELVINEKLDEALLLLDSIPDESPNFGKALFCKSMILGILGDEEESFEFFKKSIASEFGEEYVDMDEKYKPVDMNDPEDLFNCGLTSYYFGDYEKAIEEFDMSLERLPEQSEAIYYKALSLGCLGKFKKAVKTIDEAIDLNPKSDRYWNDKGALLSELNHIEKAHRCFNKSIRLKPNSYNWANKAALYHKSNNLKKALECYDKAIKYDENDVYPVVGKAKVYMELEDFKNAEKYFDLAETVDSTDLEFLVEKGKYMMFTQEYKQAIRYFDKCLHYHNDLAFVWMFKSMALKQLNMHHEADKCVEKALELDSEILSSFNEYF